MQRRRNGQAAKRFSTQVLKAQGAEPNRLTTNPLRLGRRPAIGCLGRQPRITFDLQRSAEMDVALRKRNLDTQFVERGIDGAIYVAGHVPTPVDIGDDDAQLEVE